jgi:toxin ParE1/3/4
VSGYVLSPRAQRDLDKIWDYSEEFWGVRQADRYVLDLRNALDRLLEHPMLGRLVDDIRVGYRKHRCGSHFIFYRLAGDSIVVVRILHQRMDVAAHLANDPDG